MHINDATYLKQHAQLPNMTDKAKSKEFTSTQQMQVPDWPWRFPSNPRETCSFNTPKWSTGYLQVMYRGYESHFIGSKVITPQERLASFPTCTVTFYSHPGQTAWLRHAHITVTVNTSGSIIFMAEESLTFAESSENTGQRYVTTQLLCYSSAESDQQTEKWDECSLTWGPQAVIFTILC